MQEDGGEEENHDNDEDEHEAEQTSQQRALFAEHRARAQAQSALATPKVLEFFDSPLVRETLRHCCEDLAEEPAESLLRRYRAEARASELAHAFPANSIEAMWPDVTIDEVHKEPWFLNEWQAGLLQHSNFSGGPKAVNDLTQQQIYGCRPFAGSGPTWKEAAERLIYIAHNMLRLDFGSLPGFGDVTAVFNTTLVRDMVIISPHDTGQYGMACLDEGVPGNFTPPPLNCSAWPGQVLGTMDHLDHLILPNLYMAYNTSATLPFPFNASGNRSVRNSIRALFQRSAISKVAYEDIPPLDFWASFQFLEANLLGNPRLPESVKYLIGNFQEIFGTPEGRALQRLAAHRAWPLFWAVGSYMPFLPQQMVNTTMASNRRIADPANAANFTDAAVPAGATATFEEVWSKIEEARASRKLTEADVAEARRGGSAGHVGPGIEARLRTWGSRVSAWRASGPHFWMNCNMSRARKRWRARPCLLSSLHIKTGCA
ncbi:unnamed protein product [Symbiodinium sp. CCMP2456]|nr:unnamed protein product [Symbiodinium sp. CCMP2456]